jgi:hypothetical protein
MQISLTFQEAILVDCGGLISHENAQSTKSSIAPKAGWSELSYDDLPHIKMNFCWLNSDEPHTLSTFFGMVYANFNFQGEKPVPVEV